MSRRAIRLVIVLATISLVGITITQVFWVTKAFDLKEKQLHHNINLALRNVVERICMCNDTTPPSYNPINQLSSDYYTVMVNDFIDPHLLETFLKSEFGKKDIITDFEYGIYDCSSEKMVYGNYVDLDSKPEKEAKKSSLPTLNEDNYYFGVYFPNKTSYLISEMGIWGFSSLVLLVVIVFFAYTMFVILKQKRLSEIQKDFINNMTHEFKTPISTISISSDVLKDPRIVNNPTRLLNYATIIGDESRRLQNQVERVLQMAVVDKEEIKLKREEVNVNEVIDKAIQNLAPSLRTNQGQVSCELNAEKPIIQADRLHLTNIIYNLLDNAIKYCKKIPQIRVTTASETNGIRIQLIDNGIGLKPDQQNKIFEKFYRVPTGNLHDVKGFGLGLNYVKRIVQAHNGNIGLKSKYQQGSQFSIFLPYQ